MKKLVVVVLALMLLAVSAAAETAGKTLVVYYSATGTTQHVAEVIAVHEGADLFVLEPAEPYTDEDLDWRDQNSRVVREHEAGEEPAALVSVSVPEWEQYDTVFIGYPIWWQDASWVMDTFVLQNDFSGKTVIPFCTSMASGYGESGQHLAGKAGTGIWIEGIGFYDTAEDEEITAWLETRAN